MTSELGRRIWFTIGALLVYRVPELLIASARVPLYLAGAPLPFAVGAVPDLNGQFKKSTIATGG
jgi:hypothetical protein